MKKKKKSMPDKCGVSGGDDDWHRVKKHPGG